MGFCNGSGGSGGIVILPGGPASSSFVPIGSGSGGGTGSSGSLFPAVANLGRVMGGTFGIACPSDFWIGLLVGLLVCWVIKEGA
jgi:hypothetical protein